MAESELMKASRDLAWRQFMNGVVLQSMAHHRTCRGQQVRADVQQGNSKILLVASIIELLFWLFVVIVLGGTMLMSICGIFMIVFGVD